MPSSVTTMHSELHHEANEPAAGVDVRWPASALWRPGEPAVRKIGIGDLRDAVAKGIEDFAAVPSHALFLLIIYPVVGLILFGLTTGANLPELIYPMAAGFALVGPIAAIGLYEISKRREQGLQPSVWDGFEVLKSPSIGAIARVGLILLALFALWLVVAKALYGQIFGGNPPQTFSDLLHAVQTTEQGERLMVAGNVIGFFFALAALMISVISLPMLVDRNVSAMTAVRTSLRAVIENPVTIGIWGLFVALMLVLGALPLLIGLAVVLPILGHATWHLYRRVVAR